MHIPAQVAFRARPWQCLQSGCDLTGPGAKYHAIGIYKGNISAFFRPSRRPCLENPPLQQSPDRKRLPRGLGRIPDAGRTISETRNLTETPFSEIDLVFRPNMASPSKTTTSMRIRLKFRFWGWSQMSKISILRPKRLEFDVFLRPLSSHHPALVLKYALKGK